MPRASLLILLASVALSGACRTPVESGAGSPVSRVVLISIDTLRADRLGSYGYTRPTSPVLDALAREGMRFARCTATSPWTSPSHMSMLTGLYPSRHGIRGHSNALRAGVETLAQQLQTRGFHTAAIVASDLVLPCEACKAAFEYYRDFEWQKTPDAAGPSILNRAADVNKAAVAWLRDLPPAAPFFLFLHYYDVHADYAPEPRFARLLGADSDLTPGTAAFLVSARDGEHAYQM